jgi:GT2 family glycosyltransferase
MNTVSFIILTWNSERHLERCFSSIFQKCAEEEITFEVLVIDNGSTDGSVSILRRYESEYPSFKVIALQHNRGTTFTRNLGLKQATGRYICVLDSDTELCSGSLSAACKVLAARPEAGMIAPRLLLPDGSVQNSVKRFPSLWHKLIKVPRILFGINTPNADFYANFPFDRDRVVDSAISACWILKRELLDEVGYLDERIFYSPEDLDYSFRVRKAGYRIIYYPALTVLHHTQQISHRKPFSKVSMSHLNGLIYYYKKHGGWLQRPSFDQEPTLPW